MKYIRFPLMEGKDLANIVEPMKLVPFELLFEAYKYKANPDDQLQAVLPNHRSITRNGVYCSHVGCKRKAVYACCNKKVAGYEKACEYYCCELHTFHCSANCRRMGRKCEGILHHCDRNKCFCGPISEYGKRERKNSF